MLFAGAVPQPPPRPEVPRDLDEQVRALRSSLELTDEQVESARTMPQHLAGGEANPAWLALRSHRLTGSVVGSCVRAAGRSRVENPYEGEDGLLRSMLKWKVFTGNAACAWGTENEIMCEKAWIAQRLAPYGLDGADAALVLQAYEQELASAGAEAVSIALHGRAAAVNARAVPLSRECRSTRLELSHPGILPRGIVAMSPDGLCEHDGERFLLEWKSPYGKRALTKDELRAGGGIYPPETFDQGTLPVPRYYYAQVQFGMKLFGLSSCWFGVWVPPRSSSCEALGPGLYSTVAGTVQTVRVLYDEPYALDMMRQIERFWTERYAPLFVLKRAGWLRKGEILLPSEERDGERGGAREGGRAGGQKKRERGSAGAQSAPGDEAKRPKPLDLGSIRFFDLS